MSLRRHVAIFPWTRSLLAVKFSSQASQQYEGHVPSTLLQKTVMAVGSAVGAMVEPTRADLVAALGDITAPWVLRRLHRKMNADDVGREVLRERPRLSNASVETLRGLPSHTLGRAYMDFMDSHSFSSADRPPVRFVDDETLAYVMIRYRELHDVWHALSGLPTTILGELAVKWLEMVHLGLPVATLSALVGPLRLPLQERTLLRTTYIPWAIRCGRSSANLMCVYYERHWEEPIEDVRKRLRFIPAPPMQ